MNRFFYTLLLYFLRPFVLMRLRRRGKREPRYLENIPERFGKYPQPQAEGAIWLHAVSVGETRAAAPLVERIAKSHPALPIVITSMTPTGRETAELLYGKFATICYLPYDYPFAVKRFLDHFRPKIGLLMETELWFNLIHLCRDASVPLYLVNARLSEKSLKKYERIRNLAGTGLRELSGIAAQTGADAKRLESLGAKHVPVCGNLKFDVELPEKIPDFRIFLGDRPVFLAASTREGEEERILDAFSGTDEILLLLVPRHPQRFGEVAKLLEDRNIPFVRRSERRPVSPETRVFLGDSMGEMPAYYSACDLAYIGGSLLPLGGQNLIEAAMLGKPALVGPHTFNFEEATRHAIESGAALRVEDAAQLAQEAKRLLKDRDSLKAMGNAGLLFSSLHRGAADRIMNLIAPALIGQTPNH